MSIAIITKLKKVPSLAEMNRLALKKIFDKPHMTYMEEALLEEGVKQWPKKSDLYPHERKELKAIIQALIDNEAGKYRDMKGEMVRFGLDYKKVYDCGI